MKSIACRCFLLAVFCLCWPLLSPANTVDTDFQRRAAVELGQMLADGYLDPDIGARYQRALSELAIDQPQPLVDFASRLDEVLRGVHVDAHLRVLPGSGAGGGAVRRRLGGGSAVGATQWLAGDIAYLELLGLPGDQAAQQAMADFLDRHRGARTLIIDARRCPGGTLPVIDVLASRLYAQATHLVTMEMRAHADPRMQADFDALDGLRRVDATADRVRWEHWSSPSSDPADRAWADVPVHLLTDFTASACEHLALALQSTGRARLIGATTRGAGHFGGLRSFAAGALTVFLPVGRTFDPRSGRDWEGQGIAPDEAVTADRALTRSLELLGADPALATSLQPQAAAPALALREVNPRSRSYGIGMLPPRGGEAELEILQVRPGGPAAANGLQAGDRIVAINGQAVAELDAAAIGQAMRGSPLQLACRRGEAALEVTLTLD